LLWCGGATSKRQIFPMKWGSTMARTATNLPPCGRKWRPSSRLGRPPVRNRLKSWAVPNPERGSASSLPGPASGSWMAFPSNKNSRRVTLRTVAAGGDLEIRKYPVPGRHFFIFGHAKFHTRAFPVAESPAQKKKKGLLWPLSQETVRWPSSVNLRRIFRFLRFAMALDGGGCGVRAKIPFLCDGGHRFLAACRCAILLFFVFCRPGQLSGPMESASKWRGRRRFTSGKGPAWFRVSASPGAAADRISPKSHPA